MTFILYDVLEWEAWVLPAEGAIPNRLRITTSYDLPFTGSALLEASLSTDGITFKDRDAGIELIFGPPPQQTVRDLFQAAVAKGLPIGLTEIHFSEKSQRTWLARAKQR
jgi:hypothetical protein